MGNVTLRGITDDEFLGWARAVELPFFEDDASDERFERWRHVMETPRALAACDGDRIVGTSAVMTFELSVPGGSVPMGGVTAVGVHPTHRRRGVLRSLMRAMHDDMATSREPVAGLWASESAIYGRFGYGLASTDLNGTIRREHAALRDDAPATDTAVRLVDVDEALSTFPTVHDAVRQTRPGMPSRSEGLWRSWLGYDFSEERSGASRRYLAALGDRGYVVYRVKSHWGDDGLAAGSVIVQEHMAVDAEAAATLWRYLFALDLVATVELDHRPVDDLLLLWLRDPRRFTVRASDALWLRLTRVGDALAARTYAHEDSLVLEVADDDLPDNARRWRLDAGTTGARCESTTAAADLRVRADGLGGAYLGNLRFSRLVRAGLAEEVTPGAAGRGDRLFLTEPAAWCPQIF